MNRFTAAGRPARDRSLDRRDDTAWRDDPAWRDDATWRDDAACRDANPDLFFPDGDIRSAQAQVRTAKLICRECPVSVTCLSWALASGHEAGIWGGLTEDERHRLHWRGRGRIPTADS